MPRGHADGKPRPAIDYIGAVLRVSTEMSVTVGRPIYMATLRTVSETYCGQRIRSLEAALLEAFIALIEVRALEGNPSELEVT